MSVCFSGRMQCGEGAGVMCFYVSLAMCRRILAPLDNI